MALPALDPLWRPNCPDLPAEQPEHCNNDDRESIRQICKIAPTEFNLTNLTVRMNDLASYSPATVRSIQANIDEAQKLEDDYSGSINSIEGTGLKRYKGPRFLRPSESYNEAPMSQADVVKYDTSLLQEEFEVSEGGSISAKQGSRYNALSARICEAIGHCCGNQFPGGGGNYGQGIIPLYRS